MKTLTTSLVCVGCVLMSIGVADPAETSPEIVQQLVEQLGSDQLSQRVEAEKRLREMGPDMLPLLPAPEELSSAAVRDSVRRIRVVLERLQAEQSVLPSRVTILGQLTLRELVEEMARRTGNAVDVSHLPADRQGETIDVDLRRATFWEAIGQIERRTGLTAAFDVSTHGLRFRQEAAEAEGDSHVSAATTSAFRIRVVAAERRPDFTDPARRVVRLKMQVMAEPRLRPLFLKVADADLTAAAVGQVSNLSAPTKRRQVKNLPHAERRLPPLTPGAQRELPIADRGPVTFPIDFVTAADEPIPALTLRGRVDVEVAAKEEPFVFRHLETARDVTRRRGGVRVTLHWARFDHEENGPHAGRCRLSIVYDSGGPVFESHRMWVFYNALSLERADGSRRWPHEGLQIVAHQPPGVAVEYQFSGVPPLEQTDRLVYRAATQILTVPVEFTIESVPVTVRDAPP